MEKLVSRTWMLDPTGRWLARMTFARVGENLWPIGFEARLAPRWTWISGGEVNKPFKGDLLWPDDDYPSSNDDDEIPIGGLPIRRLHQVTLKRALMLAGQDALNEFRTAEAADSRKRAERFLKASIRSRTPEGANVKRKRGGQPMDAASRLERFAGIAAMRDTGKLNTTIAKDMGISVPTVVQSLKWASTQDPPLWHSIGRGRAGSLTAAGREVVNRFERRKGRNDG